MALHPGPSSVTLFCLSGFQCEGVSLVRCTPHGRRCASLVSLRDPFVDVFSKRFAWDKLPVSRCDTENACFIHHSASGNSHQGNPVANHALEDVEVNGLMVSFGRDRPAQP